MLRKKMPLRFWLARLFGRKLVGRDGDHYVIAYHWRGCTMTSSRWFPDIGRKPKGWRLYLKTTTGESGGYYCWRVRYWIADLFLPTEAH
jgi:hypothetical protein